MDQIRETLIKIAKAKIQKTQIKPRKNVKSKTRVIKKSPIDRKPRAKKSADEIFFPKEPVGIFGYTRPHEARSQTAKEKEQLRKFQQDIIEWKRTKNYSFEDFIREPTYQAKQENINNKEKINK